MQYNMLMESEVYLPKTVRSLSYDPLSYRHQPTCLSLFLLSLSPHPLIYKHGVSFFTGASQAICWPAYASPTTPEANQTPRDCPRRRRLHQHFVPHYRPRLLSGFTGNTDQTRVSRCPRIKGQSMDCKFEEEADGCHANAHSRV